MLEYMNICNFTRKKYDILIFIIICIRFFLFQLLFAKKNIDMYVLFVLFNEYIFITYRLDQFDNMRYRNYIEKTLC